MGIPRLDPLNSVAFICSVCRHTFEAEPDRVESAPEQDWHPHAYYAECPVCHSEAEQAAWQKGLLKAWSKSTGPKTVEGKAASAANLDGHPTPDEARLTRFNGMKHGLFARTAMVFPAKPGKYPHCEGCEHLETRACVAQRACLKRAELLLKHQVAFESGDPSMLMEYRADTQARVQALIDDMLLIIAMDGGPRLKSPEWYYDKDGKFHLAAYTDSTTGELVQLHKLEAHPLLKPLIDYLAKNAMTLADLEMTPKSHDETAAMQGYLDGKTADEESALEYQERQTQALEKLSEQITISQQNLKRDPVLIEHGEADDG